MSIQPTDRDLPELHIETAELGSQPHAVYAIRHQVFVIEQGVPEEIEHDALDAQCLHVLAYWQGVAVGTARLSPGGRIGRMAVLPEYRHFGIGSALLQQLIDAALARGLAEVVLAAQVSAITFYERFGFKAEGTIFEEAGIDHLMMRRPV